MEKRLNEFVCLFYCPNTKQSFRLVIVEYIDINFGREQQTPQGAETTQCQKDDLSIIYSNLYIDIKYLVLPQALF
jgi:hypothetical protein